LKDVLISTNRWHDPSTIGRDHLEVEDD